MRKRRASTRASLREPRLGADRAAGASRSPCRRSGQAILVQARALGESAGPAVVLRIERERSPDRAWERTSNHEPVPRRADSAANRDGPGPGFPARKGAGSTAHRIDFRPETGSPNAAISRPRAAGQGLHFRITWVSTATPVAMVSTAATVTEGSTATTIRLTDTDASSVAPKSRASR